MARETAPMRLGLYARVSTHEQQTLTLQRDAIVAYAQQREEVRQFSAAGLSKSAIARRLGISRTSVRRFLG